jgi:hypothetical protein
LDVSGVFKSFGDAPGGFSEESEVTYAVEENIHIKTLLQCEWVIFMKVPKAHNSFP